jgi:hypothetical protein
MAADRHRPQPASVHLFPTTLAPSLQVYVSLAKLNAGCTKTVAVERRRVRPDGISFLSTKNVHVIIRCDAFLQPLLLPLDWRPGLPMLAQRGTARSRETCLFQAELPLVLCKQAACLHCSRCHGCLTLPQAWVS